MKYKLDKELIKKIKESDNETIELEINDDKIELVEENEWNVGDFYYYVYYSVKDKNNSILSEAIYSIDDLNAIKKDKSIKYFHTNGEIQEYIDWLDIRAIVEETIDELGRPTKEDIDNENLELYFIYNTKDTLEENRSDCEYEQPFLCKKSFLNILISKIGEIKVHFFYENLWRFL